MPDMEPIYASLRAANAAGDTASVQKLSDYIRSQPTPQQNAKQEPEAQETLSSKAGGMIDRGIDSVKQFGKDLLINPEGKVEKSYTQTAIDIGEGVLGGVLIGGAVAAMAPELAAGAGVMAGGRMALSAFGMINKTTTIANAIAGGMGAEAGNLAEQMGGGKGTVLAASAIGGASSELLSVVHGGVGLLYKFFSGASRQLESGKTLEAQKALFESITKEIPELDAHIALKNGQQAGEKAAEMLSRKTLSDAHLKASEVATKDPSGAKKIMSAAYKKADEITAEHAKQAAILNKVAGEKMAKATRIKAAAVPALEKIGPRMEPSDIGRNLQGAMTEKNNELLKARSNEYKKELDGIRQTVAQKEANGEFPINMPATQKFVAELEKKLLNTPEGIKAATKNGVVVDEIGESGIRGQYQKIYDAVKKNQVHTGEITSEGEPEVRQVKSSYDALVQLSRSLGDTAYGKAESNFAAIGQKNAQAAKKEVDEILNDYVGGNAYKNMQSQYHDASGDLSLAKTKSGKVGTAVDRTDPETFLKDPKEVGKYFFNSSTKVKDLLELTGGNKQLVSDSASSFIHHQLDGRSAQQVETYLKDNKDWIREIPGLDTKVSTYASTLNNVEKAVGGLEKEAATLDKKVAATKEQGQAVAEKTVQDARREAIEKTQVVANKGFPQDEMRDLILKGSPQQMQQAAFYLAGTPGGKEAMLDTIKLVLSRETPKAIEKAWDRGLGDVMAKGGLIPKESLAALDKQVRAIVSSAAPDERILKKLIRKAITGAIGSAVQTGDVKDQ